MVPTFKQIKDAHEVSEIIEVTLLDMANANMGPLKNGAYRTIAEWRPEGENIRFAVRTWFQGGDYNTHNFSVPFEAVQETARKREIDETEEG